MQQRLEVSAGQACPCSGTPLEGLPRCAANTNSPYLPAFLVNGSLHLKLRVLEHACERLERQRTPWQYRVRGAAPAKRESIRTVRLAFGKR
jgi:hypothetical protein